MIILGVNAYHGDSSACLVIDGKLVNAIEEERIVRIKHWAGLPIESIKWCLSDANISIKDVDYIAISRDPRAHFYKKILRAITKIPRISFIKNRVSNVNRFRDIKVNIVKAFNVEISEIKAEIIHVEHHRAHMGSSFFVSPFDEAACVTIDGFGDFVSTMRGIGKDNHIKIFDWVEFPHSLGDFYTAMTQFLGFWNYGDEYKVMGLSAYGKPVYLDEMRKIIRFKLNGLFEFDTSYFLHDKGGVEMFWENGQPVFGKTFSDKLVKRFGKPREKNEEITEHYQNIAASVQAIYEEAFFYVLNDTYKKTKLENLALAGGCIQNSLVNGKIKKQTPFKNIYIPSASHDAGTAIGAAMVVWHTKCNQPRAFVMEHAYLGPQFTKKEIEGEILKNTLKEKGYLIELINDESLLCQKAAKCIEEGKIIGWFQGRTEFGPRALGNRSILVDPRRKEMKDILNERIKRREWFRPFAPSILEEKVSEWFEQSSPVPFMEKVYKIRDNKRQLIPAVCHVDGTGRLQTVSSSTNSRYHNLIKQFEVITEVPIILNTSFNDNEPIVNTPKDAIECFLSTKMDVLVLRDFLITKGA